MVGTSNKHYYQVRHFVILSGFIGLKALPLCLLTAGYNIWYHGLVFNMSS